jgi:hypothetical protein
LQSLLRLLDLLTLALLFGCIPGSVTGGLQLIEAQLIGRLGGFDF